MPRQLISLTASYVSFGKINIIIVTKLRILGDRFSRLMPWNPGIKMLESNFWLSALFSCFRIKGLLWWVLFGGVPMLEFLETLRMIDYF